MAFFDPASAGLATLATGAFASAFMRRARGWLQRFFVALTGMCLINLLVVVVLGALEFDLLRGMPRIIGIALVPVLLVCLLASVSFHLPSLFLLGIDENLERHGALVTSIGQVADLVILAALFATVVPRRVPEIST